MKPITVVALAVVCMCMAATGSASAQQFHVTLNPGPLLGRSVSSQLFVLGGLEVTCTGAHTTGTVTASLSLHLLLTVNYTGCTADGFLNVDVSPVRKLISADGLWAIESTFSINVLGICTVTVKPQDLGTVKYKNSGKRIIEEPAVKGVTSTGSGGLCETSSTGGTYVGNSEISEEGGVISWS